jgi:hypothetical protein
VNALADRLGLLILLLVTLAGLWLGLAGPDTSPVAPPGSAPIPVLEALTRFFSSGPAGGGRR